MSTQTGIEANSDLLDFFSKAKSNRYRLIKVVITKEELALDEAKETGGDWERDWDQLIGASIDANEPCYLFYRMDEVDSNGNYKWLFISWSPDTASVRNKMLYSSTKATLKRTFGSGLICGDLFGSHRVSITSTQIQKIHIHVLQFCAIWKKTNYVLRSLTMTSTIWAGFCFKCGSNQWMCSFFDIRTWRQALQFR